MSRLSDAEIVATIRRVTGWTQTQLAHQIAVSAPQVSAIENDKKRLSRRVKEIMIHKLNVRTEWLEEGTGEPFDKNTPPPKPKMSGASKAIVTAAAICPAAPPLTAAIALGVTTKTILDNLVDAYDARNTTDLAQRFLKVSQSTVASWIRRNKIPADVIEKAAEETGLKLEDVFTNEGYLHIKEIDLFEIIKKMSEEEDLKTLKLSEIRDLFKKCSKKT